MFCSTARGGSCEVILFCVTNSLGPLVRGRFNDFRNPSNCKGRPTLQYQCISLFLLHGYESISTHHEHVDAGTIRNTKCPGYLNARVNP